MVDPASLRAEYETLKDRASETLKQGDLHAALEEFNLAHAAARRLGERGLEDVAFCNRSAVAIRIGGAEDCVPALRQMLLRTADPYVAYLSAYNLCQACDSRKDFKKVLFYARIARRYAVELGHAEYEASAVNEIGNAFGALNQFGAALEAYREADALIANQESERRSFVLANQGYCLLLTEKLEDGFRSVIRALRLARRITAPLAASHAHLCLSFGYLLIDRPWYALRHGSEALELAEEHGDQATMKHALLFVGEAYKRAGKIHVARECFELLQRTYYPGMSQVPEMLLDVDICRVINLRG
jgi:tetratricopeptide (TPR) repeat protein